MMKESKGASALLEENPYLQQVPETHQRVGASAEHGTFPPEIVDEETAEEYRIADPRKQDGHRRPLVLGGLAVLLLASFFVAALHFRRPKTRIDYPNRQTTSRSALPTGNDSRARPAAGTQKAIEEAQEIIVGPTSPNTPTANDSLVSPSTATSETVSGPFDKPQTDFNVSEFAATVRTKRPEAWTNGDTSEAIERQASAATPPVQFGNSNATRSNQGSIYANDPKVATADNQAPANSQRGSAGGSGPETVKVLPFGLMLPVHTVGGFYTLRNRALVRLELTRDMSGNGWFMKRGTIIVGTSEGADVDRAHVSIVGLVDQPSGRFVKIGGDLLGNDGTAGIKGKRRQIDRGWARMLAKVGTGALNLTSSLLAGRGGSGTMIISDGLRTRAVNPISEEISGVIGRELDPQPGRAFVEVAAGTPGYVMITDLPSNKESEPVAVPEGQYLASVTDVDATRPTTGLSERELADLLNTGSPTEIKAAMPRMSPDMRRLATAFLDR